MRAFPKQQKYLQLAKSLPKPLLRFLSRYPPEQIRGKAPPTGYQQDVNNETGNPFLPTIHPVTQRVHDPIYSLRRQADLVKQARKYGIEELLPWSTKKTEVRLAKKVEFGSRVKGTGEGQQVKGHKHERDLQKKYVVDDAPRVVAPGRFSKGRMPWADMTIQDGSKKRSHAQHAGAHQGMESGTFRLGFYLGMLFFADRPCRLEERTGRSGPTKGQKIVFHLMYKHVLKYNTYSRQLQPTNSFCDLALFDFQFVAGSIGVLFVTAKQSESGGIDQRKSCSPLTTASTTPSLTMLSSMPRIWILNLLLPHEKD